MVALLPAASNVLLLHLSAWRDAERWTRGQASGGINNRDRIAGALRQRLMELHLLMLMLLVARVAVVVVGRTRKEE